MEEQDLVDQVRVNGTQRADELEDEVFDFFELLGLDKVYDDGQEFGVEEIWLDDEASVLDHGDKGVQSDFSLLGV